MSRLRDRPVFLTALAFLIAASTTAVIAYGYGFEAFWAAWKTLHPAWLALAFTAGPLAHGAYTLAYQAVAEADGAPELPLPLVVRLVAAGFGPFTLAGGFAMDRHALHSLHADKRSATRRILGLGSLEWLLLAPIVFAAAVALLVSGDRRPEPSMVWPWAICVPLGFAAGGLLLARRTRDWLAGGGPLRRRLHRTLEAADILGCLTRRWRSALAAYMGMGLYWILDLAAFYAIIRFIGLRPNVAEAIVAYGTGYALTRRSMPLGGAGVTEALMTFSLHWMGEPVAPALAVVVLYRLLSFILPALPALLARPGVVPLVRASREGRHLTAREQRQASAPLRPIRR